MIAEPVGCDSAPTATPAGLAASQSEPLDPDRLSLLLDKAPQATALLKALSHETRLLIIGLLCDGEKSVSDLERLLALPQAAVSQHLARLRADNLVATRREGRMIHYRIAETDACALIAVLKAVFCRQPPASAE